MTIIYLYYYFVLSVVFVVFADDSFVFLSHISNLNLPNAHSLPSSYRSRKIPLNSKLSDEIVSLLSRPTNMGIHSPPIMNLTWANSFCCDCYRLGLNCPICRRNKWFACEYPFRNFSKELLDWYKDYFYPSYKLAFDSVSYISSHLPNAHVYIPADLGPFFFSVPFPLKLCSRTIRPVTINIYSPSCTLVISSDNSCPIADFQDSSTVCNWFNSKTVSLRHDLKACVATHNVRFTLFGEGKYFCSVKGQALEFPVLDDFSSGLGDNFLPDTIGRLHDDYYFKFRSFDSIFDLIHIVRNSPIHTFSPFKPLKIVCRNSFLHVDSRAYNGQPSWIGDVLIQIPCSSYVPYNFTHDICEPILSLSYPYCSEQLFRPVHGDRFPKRVHPIPINSLKPMLPANFTCSRLSKGGDCLLSFVFNRTVDRTAQKFEKLLNKTLDAAFVNFLDNLGRNDSKTYYTFRGNLVGNWLSGIFGVLIEPFFDAFINIVLKGFLPPLFSAFTSFLDQLSLAIVSITTTLVPLLTDLVAALAKLIVALINLLLGVILVVESTILLFEYTVLFLYLLYRWVNNVWFALVIVIIFILIFGLERKSPSIILHFVNPDFFFTNLTEYFKRNFSFDYRISYTDSFATRNFYLFNYTLN